MVIELCCLHNVISCMMCSMYKGDQLEGFYDTEHIPKTLLFAHLVASCFHATKFSDVIYNH